MARAIQASVRDYEAWMHERLGRLLVEADLTVKHRKMREGPFAFLRATYWRWAETVLELCPELADAAPVLAVGDLHLENFGTWRDAEGRLVFGVNDFDEAASMPWPLDLLRLVTSALLATRTTEKAEARHYATLLLEGYGAGIADPHPVLLDHGHPWLRPRLDVSAEAREAYWAKMLAPTGRARGPASLLDALRHAVPQDSEVQAIFPRTAGAGSLGRPRLVLHAAWRGGPVLREAKALLPSAWTLVHGPEANHTAEAARGPYRSPDPWYAVRDGVVMRRLSPNNRKLNAATEGALLRAPRMLRAMGRDVAAIHAGTAKAVGRIRTSLADGAIDARILARAALRMAAAVCADQAAYAKR